ncbi:uncharacterized protein LOC113233671 [Hyposmocoma kahamanoa]|uniref:uncharacterized protein LOC113233671 n=1 Tax=Hyposmocoma kahamanoa TaxID=1477025 RepID=UPI000E6D7A4C|nr:uncharacterized protein LOC113233671 [Hyposmocoma kahamanoa]
MSHSDDLDDNSNGEECDADNIKIIETVVDDESEIDFDNIPKHFAPPKDIIINNSIADFDEQKYNSEKLGKNEDNKFFDIHNSELDGYREVDDYGYDQDKYLRGCKEIKRCRRACNKVHKTLCEEFNCDKLKILFKRMCKEKCEETFADGSEESDNYDDGYYY